MAVYIIAHKIAPLVIEHPRGYIPLFVGNDKDSLSKNINQSVRDDSGDNIAGLNPYFCELTGAYWIWKNNSDGIKGLVHYRRFFVESQDSSSGPLGFDAIVNCLSQFDCIVPTERALLQNVRNDYARHHVVRDIDLARDCLAAGRPEYLSAFDGCMAGRYIRPYNMIIARGEVFDEYCSWLFPILFYVFDRVELDKRDGYQKRAIGFLSERLLDVWLAGSGHTFCEKPINFVERGMKEKLSMGIASVSARLFSH